ncbi:hypothetical protein QBC35DRAFT_234456 [Podospora australis]|uniref:Uncharacterized protein n=1 Tax=Podospora australis TaxID=1536484 RepID=A0AAN6WSG0_9PEZI|nr:hypothetical protein QBC35DRAFT_234456 [Podospora australis]
MQQKQYPSRLPLGHPLAMIALFLVAALCTRQAEAASIPSNSTIPTPPNNSTHRNDDNFALQIQQDMTCYALPYGAIGTISHVLTFYSSWCWAAGRCPLKPWTELQMVKLDTAIFFVSFIITFSLSVNTLVRCQGTEELQCVAVWKLFLAVTAFAMELYGVFWQEPEKGGFSLTTIWTFFMIPYLLSSIAGIAGLASAVMNYNDDADRNPPGVTPLLPHWLWICTFCVISVLGIMVGGMLLVLVYLQQMLWDEGRVWRTLKGVVIAMIVMNAIYSDWALAFLANDMIGQGEGRTGQTLTWVYFFAKRLAMLSF